AKCAFDCGPVGPAWHERGKAAFTARGGVRDDALDLRLREIAQEVDAIAGNAGVIREGNYGYFSGAGDGGCTHDCLSKQGAEYNFGALVDRLLSGSAGSLRRAFVIFGDEFYGRIVELEQRHFSGLLHA